jgi:ATP:corrinoid adenosyltransferase
VARVIPGKVDPEATDSEREVFAALETQLPASWVVLHGKRFVLPAHGRHRPVEGEVDFIVLDPRRGYVGIEVKGGGVARDTEGWYRRYRGRVERIDEPGRQAQKNIHGIARFGDPRRQIGWGVCLPFLDVGGSLGAELPEEFVLDKSDLRDLPKSMDRLFAANRLDGPPMIAGTLDAWIKARAPVFRFSVSLSSRISDAEAKIFRMTEEQMAILGGFAEIPRVGVKGGAGTGKTVVALELARRWRAEGLRVLFLCYNKPLADEIAKTADGFTVQTFHAFCSSMARSAGLRFDPPKKGDGAEFWEAEAPDLLSQTLDVLADDRFDGVVVDERQDFREYWWLVIEKLLRDPDESRLWRLLRS